MTAIYTAFFHVEKTPMWWAVLISTSFAGCVVFVAAYLYFTAPARALDRLKATRACMMALKCCSPKIELKLTGNQGVSSVVNERAALPECARRRHFEEKGIRLTTKRAVEISKWHDPIETRPNEKSFVVVRYNLVFEYPTYAGAGSHQPAFVRVDTDRGPRIVSSRRLLFAVAFDMGRTAESGAGWQQEWRARLQGRRRAVFDLCGALQPNEYLEGEERPEEWVIPRQQVAQIMKTSEQAKKME